MKSSNFGYLIKEGLRGLWTNRLMTLASVAVLTTCLILVGFSILISINVDAMVQYIGQQSSVVVFIKQDAEKDKIDSLEEDLHNKNGVLSVEYVSQKDALENYKNTLRSNAQLLDSLEDDNPLPASFTVTLEDLADLNDITTWVEKNDIVESTRASANTADTLVSFRNVLNMVLLAIIIALVVVSLIIISNSIRASVYARRTEIGIMRYVGATNAFIRIPFLIEGILLGLISALIAYLLIWSGYQNLIEFLFQNNNNFLYDLFSNFMPFDSVSKKLVLCLLATGPATGVLGCVTSLRKHLKV